MDSADSKPLHACIVLDERSCQHCGTKMEVEIINDEPIYWCEECYGPKDEPNGTP